MNRTTRTHQAEQSCEGQPRAEAPENELGCLLRVYWMMLGNALVAAAAFKIVQTDGGLTTVDLIYWLIVVSLMAARYVDVRSLDGRTGEGQPATMKDWRRYSLRVVGISVTLWFVAHGLSYFA